MARSLFQQLREEVLACFDRAEARLEQQRQLKRNTQETATPNPLPPPISSPEDAPPDDNNLRSFFATIEKAQAANS